jgi:hypothetical protein
VPPNSANQQITNYSALNNETKNQTVKSSHLL